MYIGFHRRRVGVNRIASIGMVPAESVSYPNSNDFHLAGFGHDLQSMTSLFNAELRKSFTLKLQEQTVEPELTKRLIGVEK